MTEVIFAQSIQSVGSRTHEDQLGGLDGIADYRVAGISTVELTGRRQLELFTDQEVGSNSARGELKANCSANLQRDKHLVIETLVVALLFSTVVVLNCLVMSTLKSSDYGLVKSMRFENRIKPKA